MRSGRRAERMRCAEPGERDASRDWRPRICDTSIRRCAALAYRWDGQCSRLFFQMKPGSYDTPSLISFLKDLRREFQGQRVLLIWDGLPAHRSKDMQEHVRAQRSWLTVERLPAYAPDL